MSTNVAFQPHKDGRKLRVWRRREGGELGAWVVRARPALKQRCLSAKIDHTPHICLLCALTPIKRSETNQMSRPRPPRPRLASRKTRADSTKLHPNPPATSRDPKTRFVLNLISHAPCRPRKKGILFLRHRNCAIKVENMQACELGARAREKKIKRQTPKLPKTEHKESDRIERNRDPSGSGRNHQESGVRQEWRPVASVAQDFAPPRE